VTLTVDDGNGNIDTDQTTATVTEVNDVPVADPNGPYTGTTGAAITFDGSGSSDYDNEDGTTANDETLTYAWDFGDPNTGTGVSPSHTYALAATYNVSLTVNDGEVDSATIGTTATINDSTETVIHVGDLEGLSVITGPGGKWEATVTITVHDQSGAPVLGATVTGTFSNGTSGTFTSLPTGSDGIATIMRSNINKNTDSVTFTVDDVTHSVFTYNSGDNHDDEGDSNGTTIVINKNGSSSSSSSQSASTASALAAASTWQPSSGGTSTLTTNDEPAWSGGQLVSVLDEAESALFGS